MRPALLLIGALLLAAPTMADGRRSSAHGAKEGAAAQDAALQQRSQQALAAGRAALARGEAKAAYDKAAEALRSVPAAETLLLLGQIALLEGRTLDAQDLMRRYLADPDFEADDRSPEQAEARRIAQGQRPDCGELKILGDAGTLISLDGRLLGSLPLSLPLLVAVGSHKIELQRGRAQLEDEVRIPLGRLAELRVDMARGTLLSTLLPSMVLFDEYRDLDGAAEQQLSQAVAAAIASEQLSPLSRELAARNAGEPLPKGCSDETPCLVKLAERSEADYLLRLRVHKQPTDWQLDLRIVSTEVGTVAAAESQQCNGCSVVQVAQKLSALFAPAYRRALARPRGRLAVSSEPPGATVELDGQKLGQTPLERPWFSGRSVITLKKEGYLDLQKEVNIPEEGTEDLSLPMTAVPKPPPSVITPVLSAAPIRKELPRPLWRIVVGSVAAAGGLVSISIGAAAVIVDGHCAEPFDLSGPTDPPGCTAKYVGTSVLGESLIPIGSGLLIGGTLLLALPKRSHRSH